MCDNGYGNKCNRYGVTFSPDFKYEICLEEDEGTSFPNFTGFKKGLPNVPSVISENVSELESDLNDLYEMKKVVLSYNVKNNEKIIEDLQVLE